MHLHSLMPRMKLVYHVIPSLIAKSKTYFEPAGVQYQLLMVPLELQMLGRIVKPEEHHKSQCLVTALLCRGPGLADACHCLLVAADKVGCLATSGALRTYIYIYALPGLCCCEHVG